MSLAGSRFPILWHEATDRIKATLWSPPNRDQRPARCVFHFVRPGLLDAVDDVLRHRDVIELLGHLVALVVGPGEELERLGGRRRILRLRAGSKSPPSSART